VIEPSGGNGPAAKPESRWGGCDSWVHEIKFEGLRSQLRPRTGAVIPAAERLAEVSDAEEMIRSCAMVITTANAYVAEVHDRMP
jgi:hypothetical protein